mgnify:CR=1 FL=1
MPRLFKILLFSAMALFLGWSNVAQGLELVEAWKKLGDHPNRVNGDIVKSRKAFDNIDANFGKNNPHTGTEMFDPETGGYVVTHRS